MMTTRLRFGRPAVVASAVVAFCAAGRAQEQSPLPRFTGERVIVVGVPDRYQALNDQIARLEKSSPQSYYVVVIKSAGQGRSATRDYADELAAAWRSQGSKGGRLFDPERSVITVVALENHQVALKPGSTLSKQFGLHADRIERDLVPAFIDLAKESRYTEAVSSLLVETNNWIAARDRSTARVPVQASASATAAPANAQKTTSKVAGTAAKPSALETTEADQRATQSQPAPLKRASSDWFPVVVLGVPILIIVAAFLGWIWVLFRRRHSQFVGRIREMKSKAADVMDRLDGLKERLKLMPTSAEFNRTMTGETEALYNSVNEKQSTLWDGWLHVMEVLDKAEKLAARSASPLSQKALDEAQELINKQGSFEAIESQAKAIEADLDRLDHAHQVTRAALGAASAVRPKIDAGLDALKKLGLPTAPYQEELSGVAAGTTSATTALVADPLGTKSVLEQLQSRSDALLARVQGVVALFADAKKAKSSLEAIKVQVAGERARGLKLIEEGGNPDPLLGQGEEARAQTLAALEAGDPATGSQKLDLAKSMAQQAAATVDKVQKARSFCERDLPARARETERLRTALSQAESYQNDLEREFARSSWQPVGRNLDQARALLATFDKQAQQAAAAATTTSQEYLKGAAQIEELARQQQIVLRLMSGLGEQLNSLMNVRDECHKLNESLADRERQAERVVRQYDAIVSDVARNSLESARRAKEEIAARARDPRPDWPALRQSLLAVIEDLEIARSQAEEDVKNHEALTEEFGQARNMASRVYAFLASHEEDRLAANQHYQAAADALDRVGTEISEPRGRSAALLEQVRGAAADLNRSEELAREDIRLAAQAQTEIAEAGRAINQARSYTSMGYGVDTSGPESQVMQAQQLLQSQNYEQSIQLAGASMQSARQVYYAAMQHALMRQMTMAAEERRRVARVAASSWNGVSVGAAAATAAAAAILDRAASAASEATTDSPESDTGVGSWSSDTGQGSW
jgi:hypothetical protein